MPKEKEKVVKVKAKLEFNHHDMLMTRFVVKEIFTDEDGPKLRGPATVELEANVLDGLIPDFSPQHNSAEGEVEFTFKFK